MARYGLVDVVEHDVEHVKRVERSVDGVVFGFGDAAELPSLCVVFKVDGDMGRIILDIRKNLFALRPSVECFPFVFRHGFHGFVLAEGSVSEHTEVVACQYVHISSFLFSS